MCVVKFDEMTDLSAVRWQHHALLCARLGSEGHVGAQSTQASVPLSGMVISSTCERRTAALQVKLIKHSHIEAMGAGMRDQACIHRRAST